ncbi:MAG: glycosyltransferase family 2 protein [Bacteroides sp.]|nr:glycosyltransferase family 2 protein [Roseburia sp.]MCM1345819.1 glycosyltransferase family 2 protein [Bacteroides sp.]MCM1421284.1 glycosyltransferase family 2 protein [Bacteroides sp.]
MMQKITVIIHTCNAEKYLEQVLKHLVGFDELLVCDMESTDNTLPICREYGCRIITFPKGSHTIVEPARDFAIHQATNPWILEVDADEIVTEELRSYLYKLTESPNCPDGLYIPRKNFFMGRFMHANYPNHILRFFHRDKTCWPPYIHSAPEINGRVEYIPRFRTELAFIHLADESVSERIRKIDVYTDNELIRRSDKKYGMAAFLYRPLHRFCKYYFQKGGFRDGIPGIICALFNAYYQIVMLAKYHEQRRHCL